MTGTPDVLTFFTASGAIQRVHIYDLKTSAAPPKVLRSVSDHWHRAVSRRQPMTFEAAATRAMWREKAKATRARFAELHAAHAKETAETAADILASASGRTWFAGLLDTLTKRRKDPRP